VAGIDTDGPGFKRLLLHPQPGKGLTWVKASYRSLHGRIASEWKDGGKAWTWRLTIPANTTATVCVPGKNVTIDGQSPAAVQGVKSLHQEGGLPVYEVPAGTYDFVVQYEE